MNALWFWEHNETTDMTQTIVCTRTKYGPARYLENAGAEDRYQEFYALGIIPPHYPVPATIYRVQGHGLMDGLFDRNRHGVMVWGVYDNPLPDGSFDAGNGYDELETYI